MEFGSPPVSPQTPTCKSGLVLRPSWMGLDEQTFKQPALANTRQIGLLKQAKNSLIKAKEDSANDLPVDLVSINLMDAYYAILDILGERNKADLSKEIFSRFCVGK